VRERETRSRSGVTFAFAAAVGLSTLAALLIAALLTNIFERKQEARNPYVRLVEVTEETTDPTPWGMNWSREHDDYRRTVDVTARSPLRIGMEFK